MSSFVRLPSILARVVSSCFLASLALPLLQPAHASAGEVSSRWIALAPLAGMVRLDGHLRDYRWDPGPISVWAAQAMTGKGRLAMGVRFWRSSTTQMSGIPTEGLAPTVALTAAQLFGEVALLTLLSIHLSATASAGYLHVGYSPDRFRFGVAGSDDAIEVAYTPMNEWVGGGGFVVRRPLSGPITLGLQLEKVYFSLDTAHRNGAEIEENRETFGSWAARAEISWRIFRSPNGRNL